MTYTVWKVQTKKLLKTSILQEYIYLEKNVKNCFNFSLENILKLFHQNLEIE